MLLLIVALSSSASALLNDSLKVYYQFNETSGTVIYNQVNDSNHGVITGTQVVTGIIDSARNFSGLAKANRILFNKSMLEIKNQSTWNVWVKSNKITEGVFIGKWGTTTNNFSILFRTEADGRASFSMSDGSKHPQLNTTTGGLSAGTWYMFTAMQNSTHMLLYVNGKFNNSLAWAKNMQSSTGTPLTVGAYTQNYAVANLHGRVDEIGVWNRSLSQAEITQLYNNGSALSFSEFNKTTANNSCTYSGSGQWNINISDNCTLQTQTVPNAIRVFGTNGTLTINGTVLANKTILMEPSTYTGKFVVAIIKGYTFGVFK